ncbi:MAG: hypothetical protein ABI700_11745 [Chloroflexota bacterium]
MAEIYSVPEAQPKRRSPVLKWLSRLLIGAALIVLLVTQAQGLILFAQHIPVALDDPYTLNYGEGPLLDQAVRLSRGENIYQSDLTRPPYTITNYPPLYVLAQVPFVEHFGAAFWYGRLISLISLLVAALFLGLTVQTITKDWLAGLAAALTLPAIPYLFYWSALARIDSLALALSMAGLFVIVRSYRRRSGLILAVLLLTAAAYTRQTYLLAAPLAGFVYVWGRGERFKALAFAVLLGCVVLGLFALVLVDTRGGIFFHIITANVNALNPDLITHYVNELTLNFPILLAAGGIYLIGGLIFGRPAYWMIAPYILGALIVALTISKVGSDVNYLFELSAALCFAAGGVIAMLRRWFPLRAASLVILAAAVYMATSLTISQYQPILTRSAHPDTPVDKLVDLIRTTNEPIIADEQMGLLALNGKPILFQPFEMSQLALAGLWNQQPFLDALARGDYPIILLYQPSRNPQLRFERWTPDMLRIINNDYRPDFQSAETTVYRYAGP